MPYDNRLIAVVAKSSIRLRFIGYFLKEGQKTTSTKGCSSKVAPIVALVAISLWGGYMNGVIVVYTYHSIIIHLLL